VNSAFQVYLIAFVGGLLTTVATQPLWRAWCLRVGLVDDQGHRKIHDAPIPLAGGLAVLTGVVLPLGIAAALLKLKLLPMSHAELLLYGLNKRALQLAAIGLGAIAMTILGVLDDKHELRPLQKFAGQFLIAGLVAAAGTRITLFVPNVIFSYAVTILWILTVINAFNFMDNMNGLCGGLGAISAGWFAVIAAMNGQYLVALSACLICGALLGFLPYNFPKARVFIGDSGSHLVGYLLAVLAILPHFYTEENPRRLAVLTPLLVLAVPLADMVWVVLLRWRMGKPFYIGDTNHLSHRLTRIGFSRMKAVVLIWLIAALIGALALI
jgi:UDP-GlcNAc:undecaprenyl-phosphate/decaprenyl-phosphate GlcNAc-1-phosphate transferase